MRLPVENDTGLFLSSCEISFSEDLFEEESFSFDPVFCEVKKTVFSVQKERGKGIAPEEHALDDLKFENYLSESELKQWKRMPQTDRERILRKVYNTEEYQKLKEVLARYQVSALRKPSDSPDRIPFRGEPDKNPKNAGVRETEKRSAGIQNAKEEDVKPQAAAKHHLVRTENPSVPGTEKIAEADGKNVLSQGMKTVKVATEIFRQERQFVCQDNGGGQKQEVKGVKSAIRKTIEAVMSLAGAVFTGQVPVFVFFTVLAVSVLLFPLLAVLLDSANTVAEHPGIMPYYAQADYPTTSFNGKTVKSSGCGITSMAMVVSLLKGEAVTPPALAEMANKDSNYNTVQSHQAISKFAEYYELGEVEQMAGPAMNCCGEKTFDLNEIKEKIAEGCPMIASLTGGYYNPSGGGHYIALYGSGKGGVFVYDPGNRNKYAESLRNDGSDWSEVFSHSKHIWIFKPYAAPDYMDTADGTNCMAVYLCLKQAGFSDAAASGVVGNMWQECAHGCPDLRPAMESADGSVGLLQWRGGRRTLLENLAGNRSSSWMDISVQIEYLLQEINSGSQWIWTDYAEKHYPAASNLLLEEYKQLEDPQMAAEVFCAKFVRPNYEKANLPYRKEMASQFYIKITKTEEENFSKNEKDK